MGLGITCCFPRIENGDMIFYDCKSLADSEFERSPMGIKEPLASGKRADPESIDVVVLPAVAYNEEGARLGMGGGYYDRYLAKYPVKTVGICYAECRRTQLPHDAFDIKMNCCVTEQKTEEF